MAQTLFTARSGGTSKGEYASLNFGDHVGDVDVDVQANRQILTKLLSQKAPVFMSQVHGDFVVEVNSDSYFPTADAMITREAGLPLVVLSADCLPILIAGQSVVGVVHAGRKGILNGIIAKTVQAMRAAGGSELTAIIGPAICKDCYEVDPQMYIEAISQDPSLATSDARHSLDLSASAQIQLAECGVLVSAIDICTAHGSGYFSYRRDGITGRSAGVIVL